MKANEQEGQLFSDSIDQINTGMEAIINLYNELEPDEPFIQFDPDVIEKIRKVKEKYGDTFVDQKINTVVKEMIDWLPVDDQQLPPTATTPSKKTKKSETETTTSDEK